MLPDDNTPWPPLAPEVRSALADWSAWYSANPDKLAERYLNRGTRDAQNRPSQMRGGVVGRFARWWWGQPTPLGEKRAKIHVPLASDIARTSSELLFSEPPQITTEDTAAQERIDTLMKGGLRATLLEAGQVCAALGGVFLRNVWDPEISPLPWIAPVHADAAIPDFSYGRLRAVTFWTVLEDDGQRRVRHLERHERGVIRHAVFEGTLDNLGKRRDLGGFEATRGLILDGDDYLTTGAPGHLTAHYVPNMRPARDWRDISSAAWWGQSDFQGIEGLFDALDETYASWMRDVRLGAGRVLMPDGFLQSHGPGQGASWEDREILTGLNIPPTSEQAMQIVQFAIRVAEHRDTAAGIISQAIRQAGYSGATFSEGNEGTAVTATEVKAREKRSMTTRSTKTLYWEPELAGALEADAALCVGRFRQSLAVERPKIEFGDSVTEDVRELAETAAALRTAEAASTETLVALVNPGRDQTWVKGEARRILKESSRGPQADPTMTGAEQAAAGGGLFGGGEAEE
ncbi:phage portal protein [Streptomyces sp. Z26]|uniref:phage portal protein n=1 Tax=Streptomyces sp. Z26 TaxID=2500177 RepID=UPI000EF1701B|nr:phage portal protein [Streptomyces sp. Z26]RLL66984.1 phage portal protein [Streptomyces sp. Z26]